MAKRRNPEGPTARILRLAEKAPGNLIRWGEAEEEYLMASVGARRQNRLGQRNYHMSIKHVLKRHFLKVEGTRGLYVLLVSTNNYSLEEDQASLRAFQDTFGSGPDGMSTRDVDYPTTLGGAALRYDATMTIKIPPRMSDIKP